MSRQTYYDDTERLSEAAIERLDECREKHEHGCPCVAGGDPILRTENCDRDLQSPAASATIAPETGRIVVRETSVPVRLTY